MSKISDRGQYLSWNFIASKDSHLTQVLPELNALRQVTEQNDWHNNDALQQSLSLFRWIRQLPASLLEFISLPETILHTLLTSIANLNRGCYTTQALLTFAALIHDLGKAKTFQHLPDGTTRCPGHEAAGARMAPAICARFDFTAAEIDFITKLVGAHGEPYALFKRIVALPAPQQQVQIRRFEAVHADHLRPLLLLAWGDMITSHLRTIRPEKYEAVFDFYRRWLQSVFVGGK